MATYSLRTRILSSNPYKNIYNSNSNSNSYINDIINNSDYTNNNYWILIFLLIVLTLVAVFVGSIYNTQGYYKEGFGVGDETPTKATSTSTTPTDNNQTLYFYHMDGCKWCDEYKSSGWKKLINDMKLNQNEYYFKAVDRDINNERNEIIQKYKIYSAPTLILVNNNDSNKFKVFEKDRNNIDDLKNFGNEIIN